MEKNRDPENLRRIIYELTDKGWDLAPILCEMIRWSGKYDPDTAAPKEFLKALHADAAGVIKKLRVQTENPE